METLEAKLGYVFRDRALLENALTHSSYANEKHSPLGSNERLEFLGDSVLGMVTADFLYTAHGQLPEGDLTRLRAKKPSTGITRPLSRSWCNGRPDRC